MARLFSRPWDSMMNNIVRAERRCQSLFVIWSGILNHKPLMKSSSLASIIGRFLQSTRRSHDTNSAHVWLHECNVSSSPSHRPGRLWFQIRLQFADSSRRQLYVLAVTIVARSFFEHRFQIRYLRGMSKFYKSIWILERLCSTSM